ncbi:MAG: hypothetical protein KDJ55_04035 [Rhodobiaceae bacterium]|nr:hypothetical protein [Rhodobiaceae bacterium]MCC0012930.1 hypothetical protein [Rhodobiaceae bacterium]MCC0018949.1 hypothetical protein [Rhodobiaceae bacterium]MCC0060043.1 hypothetical protein [Rhodobiaceae bacterium]
MTDLMKPETLDTKLAEAARDVVTGQLADHGRRYDRMRALKVLRAPDGLGKARNPQVVRWLEKALRNERSKALTGHWSYDANRHLLLKAALKSELVREPAFK